MDFGKTERGWEEDRARKGGLKKSDLSIYLCLLLR